MSATVGKGNIPPLMTRLKEELSLLREQVAVQDELIKELEKQAHEDSLTALPNRRAFEREMKRALHQYRRYRRSGAVLLVDINSFKSINDSLGHAAGDRVLQHVARLLRQHVRESDMVARWAGDEFVILMVEADGVDAELKAAELMAAIKQVPCRIDDQEVSVSLSIGSCGFEAARSVKGLIERADAAMYEQKSNYHTALAV